MSETRHTQISAPPVAEIIAWDTCAIAKARGEYLREENPELSEDEAYQAACRDPFLFEDAWHHLIQDLGAVLSAISPEGRFYAQGRNLGWRQRSGYATFQAHDAGAFLRKLLPDTDCTFTIERSGGTLHITNYHHDAPTGEFYTVTAAESEDGT